MPEHDYKALYEAEKLRREKAERKYDDLVELVRPLLRTVDEMRRPLEEIQRTMQMTPAELDEEARRQKG
ncbi:MAG TPA: hypothetical protein VF438_02750 [Candidatus Paceibacterota bacterium]